MTRLFHLRQAAAVVPLALAGSVPAAAQQGTEERTPAGAVELVRETWRAGPDQVPLIHAPNAWTKHHLRWRSADSVVAVDLEDDGAILRLSARGRECSAVVGPLQYGGDPGERGLWRTARTLFDAFLTSCPRVEAGAKAAYAAELARARPSFAPAVATFKQRVTAEFRAPIGCSRPKRVPASAALSRCDQYPGPSV